MSDMLNDDPKAVRHLVDGLKGEYERDEERAHRLEDETLWAFVELVAEGPTGRAQIREVARELMKLGKTERTQWYA